jgi:hypothetical protein
VNEFHLNEILIYMSSFHLNGVLLIFLYITMLFGFRGLAFCYGNRILKSQEDPIPTRTNAIAHFPLLHFEHLHSCRFSLVLPKSNAIHCTLIDVVCLK